MKNNGKVNEWTNESHTVMWKQQQQQVGIEWEKIAKKKKNGN